MAVVAEASGNGGGAVGAGPEPRTDDRVTDESTAIEASRVVKDSPGRVFGFAGYSGSASTQWIQLHDATSLPVDGSVPKYSFKVVATSNFSFTLDEVDGDLFENGIVICNSSTHATKTIGSADTMFNIIYR